MIETKLLATFILLNIFNVIIQTVKSLCTVKCTKLVAALVNAVAYGFYTIVVIYMICDLPLYLKVTIIAICNLIGVYIVKLFEEKIRKDKLWKVESTIPSEEDWHKMVRTLKKANIPVNYIDIGKYVVVNCFCKTQKESAKVKLLLNKYHAKYFVSESKTL